MTERLTREMAERLRNAPYFGPHMHSGTCNACAWTDGVLRARETIAAVLDAAVALKVASERTVNWRESPSFLKAKNDLLALIDVEAPR